MIPSGGILQNGGKVLDFFPTKIALPEKIGGSWNKMNHFFQKYYSFPPTIMVQWKMDPSKMSSI